MRIGLMVITISNVHAVVVAPIQSREVLSEIKHQSMVIITDLIQSQVECNSWFHYNERIFNTFIDAKIGNERKAIVATSTNDNHGPINFLGLYFGQLTAVPGKVNSLLHISTDFIYLFHVEATYSATNPGMMK